MSKNRYELTPEQLALSEARKAKKLEQQAAMNSSDAPTIGIDKNVKILSRNWIQLSQQTEGSQRVKLMTWNLLAQTLIRRELFPTSTCLKSSAREPMIHTEVTRHSADILCLQEVDRLEKLLPTLEKAGYSYHYASGPGKKHGCLIAFKTDMYKKLDANTILYDVQDVRGIEETDKDTKRYGGTFRTKNIGSLIALQDQRDSTRGVIVATTHLFWHPKYTYERARQAGILFREVVKFRNSSHLSHWPCMVAGDFNFAPDDAAYSLLVKDPILPSQEGLLQFSRVVHLTIDPTVQPTSKSPKEDDEGGSAQAEGEAGDKAVDPDRVITNARRANPQDGLLSTSELEQLFSQPDITVTSVYDEGVSTLTKTENHLNDEDLASTTLRKFGDRVSIVPTRRGAHEPEWTSYTHYWKTVLDYIFIINPANTRANITRVLQTPRAEQLEPGLPQKDVCGSDHISLCAEVEWIEGGK